MHPFAAYILLALFALTLSGGEIPHGIAALLPPVLRVSAAPLHLRGAVYRTGYNAMMSEGYRLRSSGDVRRCLTNEGCHAWYDFSAEQYARTAAMLQVPWLYQIDIDQYAPETVEYRNARNRVLSQKHLLRLGFSFYRIDGQNGRRELLARVADAKYDSTDTARFPAVPGGTLHRTREEFNRAAVALALRQLCTAAAQADRQFFSSSR